MICELSAIIPTADRCCVLIDTLESLAKQDLQPAEVIIIDASVSNETYELCVRGIPSLLSTINYQRAQMKGAASQRNEGCLLVKNPFILFCDDDIIFEPSCISHLWRCINSNANIGAVNAIITNQKYSRPGWLTSMMYKVMSGTNLNTYAGKCIGPAWNLLPEDSVEAAEYQRVDWLGLTCVLYRRNVLPFPPFSSIFKGYSIMEDLTLSLLVGKNNSLYNVRSAKIFHNSQPGNHKNNIYELSKMEIENRYYVMTRILCRNTVKDYFKLILLEFFFICSSAKSFGGILRLPIVLFGKFAGVFSIMRGRI